MSFQNQITVATRYSPDVIEQAVTAYRAGHTPQILANETLHLRDQGTRDALIALGWTPPA